MDRKRSSLMFLHRYQLLRDWYGEEFAKGEMVAHTPGLVDINKLIQDECEQLCTPEVSAFIKLESNWSEIVGEQIALYANPVRLSNGVLFLEVRHSALIRELAPSLDLILARVIDTIGADNCKSIQLVAGGRQPRKPRR